MLGWDEGRRGGEEGEGGGGEGVEGEGGPGEDGEEGEEGIDADDGMQPGPSGEDADMADADGTDADVDKRGQRITDSTARKYDWRAVSKSKDKQSELLSLGRDVAARAIGGAQAAQEAP